MTNLRYHNRCSVIPSAGRAREPEPALFSKLLLSSFLLGPVRRRGGGPRGPSRSESAGRGPGDAVVTLERLSSMIVIVTHTGGVTVAAALAPCGGQVRVKLYCRIRRKMINFFHLNVTCPHLTRTMSSPDSDC